MEAFVLKLFNMSISASWVVLAVVVLRFVLKNAPKSVRVLLWGLVALRLIFPFSLKSPTSVLPSAEVIPVQQVSDRSFRVNTGFEAVDVPVNKYISVNRTQSLAESEAKGFDLSYIWLAGIVVLALYGIFSYLRLRKKVSPSKRLDAGVYSCDYIGSPFILGVVRPKIYLPSNLNDAETEYVLSHEKAHIKRLDFVWKPFGYVLLCVYWFNPVMWLGYVLLCRDIELACDERVIRDMETDDIRAYSQTLLNLSVPRKMILSCPVAFGEVGVKERIKSILSYKKPAFWVILTAIIAVIAVTVCFLTDPEHGNTYFRHVTTTSSAYTTSSEFEVGFGADIRYVTLTVEQWYGDTLIYSKSSVQGADDIGSFEYTIETPFIADPKATVKNDSGEIIISEALPFPNGEKYSGGSHSSYFGDYSLITKAKNKNYVSDGDTVYLDTYIFSNSSSIAFPSNEGMTDNLITAADYSDKYGAVILLRADFSYDYPSVELSYEDALNYLKYHRLEDKAEATGQTADELVERILTVGIKAFEEEIAPQVSALDAEREEYKNAQNLLGRYTDALDIAMNYLPSKGEEVNYYLRNGTVKTAVIKSANIHKSDKLADVEIEGVDGVLELYHFSHTIYITVDDLYQSGGLYKNGSCYELPNVYGTDMLVLRSADGFCELLCISSADESPFYEADDYEEAVYSWYIENIKEET